METVIAAAIGALPATVAAWAALKASRHTKTSNGHKLGELGELIAYDLKETRKALEGHILDQAAHRRETE